MRFAVDLIPPGSKLVRFMVGDTMAYDRMTVVTESEDGETLYIQGWVANGEAMGAHDWQAARDELFPRARRVKFLRWVKKSSRWREVTIAL